MEEQELTPEKLQHNLLLLRDRVTEQRDSIARDVASESGRFSAKAPINMAEQASDEQELDFIASRLTASSETLQEIDEALSRIDEGKFNVCEECGKEIGMRRLKIQPWASLCVSCKRKLEEEDS